MPEDVLELKFKINEIKTPRKSEIVKPRNLRPSNINETTVGNQVNQLITTVRHKCGHKPALKERCKQ